MKAISSVGLLRGKVSTLCRRSLSPLIFVMFTGCSGFLNPLRRAVAPLIPTKTTITASESYTNDSSVTLTLSSRNATEMYLTRVAGCASGGTWAPYATSSVQSLNPDASNTFYVKFRSSSGSESKCVSTTVIQDSTDPVVSIDSPAAGSTIDASNMANFTISGSCSEDGRDVSLSGAVTATTPCSGNSWSKVLNLSGQADGAVIINAAQTDLAGNSGQDSRSFTKSIPPTLASVTVTNTSPTKSTTYNLSYGALSEAITSYCILENDTTVGDCSWTASTSLPASFAVSATNNAKVLSVWIKDSNGNPSARVDSNSVTLDTVAPTLASVTVTNASPTPLTSYSLTFGAASETVAAYCILENDTTVGNCTFNVATLPASYTVTSTEGAKVLSVWIKDAAGNVSTRKDSNSVTLDTTAPANPTFTSITPTGPSTDSTPVVKGASSADTTTVSLYDSSSCGNEIGSDTKAVFESTGVTATVATNSTTNIYAKAFDAAGNSSSCVSMATYKHDSVAPTLASATVTNSDPSSSTTYSLSYGALSEAIANYCILENDTTVGDCSWTASATLPSSFTVSAVNEAKVLSVWVKDAAGNTSTRVDTNSVTLAIATSQPYVASITVSNSDPTNSTTYNLTWGSVNGAFTDYCILENDTDSANCAWVPSASLPSTFTVSATEEAKILSVYLKNGATVGSGRDSNSVTLDTTAATLASVTVTNSDPTKSTTYNLTYGAITGTYASYCILENDTTESNCSYTAGTLPTSFVVTNTDEAKILSVWLKDSAGNVSTRKDSNSVTLDTTAPTVASVTISNADPTKSTTYNLTYGAVTDTIASYCILENDSTIGNCSWTTAASLPATFTVDSTNEAKVLSVWLRDSLGNTSSQVDSNSVTLDTVAPADPVFVSISPVGPSADQNPEVKGTSSADTATVSMYDSNTCGNEIGSDTKANFEATGVTAAVAANTTTAIYAKSFDVAGNGSNCVSMASYTHDDTAPVLASVTISNSDPTKSTTYNLTYGAVTGTYDRYCILENDTTESNCSYTAGTLPTSFVVTNTDEAKVLSVWLKDSAGNVSTRKDSNSVTLDTTAPTLASATVTNSDPTASTTYNLTYGANSESTGTYSYCILENDTTEADCIYTSADLPSTFTVSSTENAKVLSIWIRDAAGNKSAEVDTNSVTLSTTAPTLASVSVSNSSPTNSTTYNLTYGAVTGTYDRYCILENDTTESNCTYTVATLPTTFTVSSTENAKVLSVWIKYGAGGAASTRVDSNSVTLDTTLPTLASAAVSNASPTKLTSYSLTYGALSESSGTYSYCILENNTTESNCSYTNADLPSSFTVGATENAKVLSVWVKDAAGNKSTRTDTNSVTLDTTAPANPVFVSITPTGPSSNQSPVVKGTSSADTSTVSMYDSNTCGNEIGSDTKANFEATGVTAAVAANTTTAIYAKAWDAAGNSSSCVSMASYTHDDTAPVLASVTVTNSDPTKSTTYNLTYGTITGTYASYCILENDTTESNCSYTAGTLPTSFVVSSTDEAKVLSVWLKDSVGNVSTRKDSNSVTLDTTAPTVASVTISNADPTKSTTYNLTYGAVTDTIASYCILENDSVVGDCSWTTAASLPATFTVDSTNEAKILSVWLKDALGNTSARVASNSVTLDTVAPANPAFVSISPVGPSADQSPEVKGTSSADTTTVSMYDSNTCGNEIGSDTKANFEATGVTATVAANTTTAIYAKAWDAAGNSSSCVSMASYIHDDTGPTVAISLSTGQNATTSSLPVSWDVVFSEPIDASTFTTADISQNASATSSGVTWSLTNTGDDTTFTLEATAVTSDGTLIPNIAANAVQDPVGNNSSAFTATTDSVTYTTPALATQLAFSVEPSNVKLGDSINPAIEVEIRDAGGALVSYATDAVTLTIKTNPGSATLGGTTTVNAINGVATFSDISLDKMGTGYVLTASSGTLSTADSATFDVSAGDASVLAFLAASPTTATQDVCAGPFTIESRDSGGNVSAVSPALDINLSEDGSGAGLFYTTSDCSGSSVTKATIADTQSQTAFYFKHDTAESLVITASAVGFSDITQNVTVSAGSSLTPDTWIAVTGRVEGRTAHSAIWTGSEMIVWGGRDGAAGSVANALQSGARYNPATDSWAPVAVDANTPSARYGHTAVWTGSKMIVWGGHTGAATVNTGGVYDPSTDSWTQTSVGANLPGARYSHTAVWTGTYMIVWGGNSGSATVGTGGRYDPTGDSWLGVSTGSNVPPARWHHSAVWTGTYMVIFGGDTTTTNSGAVKTGGRYDPTGDTWLTTKTTGGTAPAARFSHTAVWDGSSMIIWGGWTGSAFLNVGSKYDPAGDVWTAIATPTLTGRSNHTAIWTGSKMIVWGGVNGSTAQGDGGIYNSAGDSWTYTSSTNVPDARTEQTAVYSSERGEMIVWGGTGTNVYFNSGGVYNVAGDSWTQTSLGAAAAPAGLEWASAVWTGTEVIVWGGRDASTTFPNTGGRYNPTTDSWTATSTGANVPSGRYSHTAVWAAEASAMVVWGGFTTVPLQDGGRYYPATNSWDTVLVDGTTPSIRYRHTAVWTGTYMIVWGGQDTGTLYLNTGGLYDPINNTWDPTQTVGAPTARFFHSAVYAPEIDAMIVWGGKEGSGGSNTQVNSGGIYSVAGDSWTATDTTDPDTPSARWLNSAVWTGSKMIVWGGSAASTFNTGGIFDPAAPAGSAWTATSVGANVPSARWRHTAFWTGSAMLIWGGANGTAGGSLGLNDGGVYDPSGNSWTPMSTTGAPDGRVDHVGVWTGTEMFVYSGVYSVSGSRYLSSGGRYAPP